MLRDLLKLPSPVDLGWSEHNALGLREFTPYQEGKSWEDWHEHCKAHFPFRYFLAEQLPDMLKRRIIWPVMWPMQRFRDYVLDYTVPSRRQHLLDLRNIDPLLWYKHGHIEPCYVFWLAGWHSLMRWRTSPMHRNPRDWMTPEQQAAPEHQAQLESYDELMALVHYWQVTRIERQKNDTRLYEAMNAIETTPENRARYEVAEKEWLNHHHESERLEEEMWLRLAKMRQLLIN